MLNPPLSGLGLFYGHSLAGLANCGCFNELRVMRMQLDPTSSRESITGGIKAPVCGFLNAAGCSLQYLGFAGFPLPSRKSISFVTVLRYTFTVICTY